MKNMYFGRNEVANFVSAGANPCCLPLKNQQYHKKVMLKSFHLNCYTLLFHPQMQKVGNKELISLRVVEVELSTIFSVIGS